MRERRYHVDGPGWFSHFVVELGLGTCRCGLPSGHVEDLVGRYCGGDEIIALHAAIGRGAGVLDSRAVVWFVGFFRFIHINDIVLLLFNLTTKQG